MYGINFVNMRETKLLVLCTSSSNLADMHVNHGKRINPFDFGGHRSKFRVTMDIYRNKLVSMIETKTLCCFFIKCGRHVNHRERMNSIEGEVHNWHH